MLNAIKWIAVFFSILALISTFVIGVALVAQWVVASGMPPGLFVSVVMILGLSAAITVALLYE